MSEKLDKLIEKELRRQELRLMINRAVAKPTPPHLRPHTWVFLLQRENRKEPITCLGIVFHTWDRAKYNMLRFTASDGAVVASGRLTVLDNGETGIVLDERWPWTTLTRKFRGLSAGDL